MNSHFLLHFVPFPELDALRRVRDSNPRYDVMRIPHFECGSFDHSDNSPSRSHPSYAFENHVFKVGTRVLRSSVGISFH